MIIVIFIVIIPLLLKPPRCIITIINIIVQPHVPAVLVDTMRSRSTNLLPLSPHYGEYHLHHHAALQIEEKNHFFFIISLCDHYHVSP